MVPSKSQKILSLFPAKILKIPVNHSLFKVSRNEKSGPVKPAFLGGICRQPFYACTLNPVTEWPPDNTDFNLFRWESPEPFDPLV